jgi:hypothetical protein
MKTLAAKKFALCIKNRGHEASLEIRKVYPVLPDSQAARHGLVRVIDESGEDYLYPDRFFITVSIPQTVRKVFSTTLRPQSRRLHST